MTEHALHARFLRGLAVAPDRVALRVGRDCLTYSELHERALVWAGTLLSATDEPPRAVGVLGAKSVESYVGVLACLYAGVTVVPLHVDFPLERTRGMLAAAGVSVVVSDSPAADLGVTVLTEPDPRRALTEPRPVAPSDTAYVLFTSGSTGRPKGVPITHANTDHYFRLLDRRYDFTPEDVFSQTFDLNFDCAMFDLFCGWGAGASVHAVPPTAYRDLPAFVAERRLTVWFSTPSAIALVRRMGGLGPGAMPSLRWSLFAGEALHAADATDWQAAANGSALENIYGPTELTVTVTGHRWDPLTSPARCVNGLVPIGTVHDGHDYLLLDEDGGDAETEGELCIAGPQLTPGYLDPADGDGRFLDRAGKRWYRTGDRVRRLPDDELVYLGRLDSQVQVHGWRVELAEVEHALRSCPGVREAVAVARSGPDGTELVAFYTGAVTPAPQLARWMRQVLPPGMLPREYRHVDGFPLNFNRKIDRSRLTRMADR
ncbi:AMP-binding protein [Saccharothrix deserti]|uniref:AMP-binding protein n=1 Tax=Saccharothrix deserti TaxID=2593674 RepID=UPI00131B7B54|nr:AMP-binding protein [Saccharothrix deserti]